MKEQLFYLHYYPHGFLAGIRSDGFDFHKRTTDQHYPALKLTAAECEKLTPRLSPRNVRLIAIEDNSETIPL